MVSGDGLNSGYPGSNLMGGEGLHGKVKDSCHGSRASGGLANSPIVWEFVLSTPLGLSSLVVKKKSGT